MKSSDYYYSQKIWSRIQERREIERHAREHDAKMARYREIHKDCLEKARQYQVELDQRDEIQKCEKQKNRLWRERQKDRLEKARKEARQHQIEQNRRDEIQKREEQNRLEREGQETYTLRIPPAVLIIYSTIDRDGAEAEKEELTKTLLRFKLSPIIEKDLTRAQILKTIRDVQADENLSGMMVIIMSHGLRGAISTADGLLNINDILLQMNVPCLQGKPKILVVQACQSAGIRSFIQDDAALDASTDAATVRELDARCTSSAVNDHLDLRHADFMLMMATINGGTAHRNLLIPKFCKQLDNLAPYEDMYMAFLRTHREILNTVTEDELAEQVAEFRSTLRMKINLKQMEQV